MTSPVTTSNFTIRPHGRSRQAMWALIGTLLRRYVRSSVPYVSLTFGILVLLIVLNNVFSVVSKETLVVLSDPYILPLLALALIAGLLHTLLAASTVTRELEQGTLEVVFYSPIRFREYLIAVFLSHLLGYGLLMLCFAAVTGLLSAVTHLQISPVFFGIAAFSFLFAAAMIALGLLAAAGLRSTRNAFLVCLAVVVALLVLKVALVVMEATISGQGAANLIVIRDVLEAINWIADWLAPTSYFLNGANAWIRADGWASGLNSLLCLAFAAVAILLAVRELERKGVLR